MMLKKLFVLLLVVLTTLQAKGALADAINPDTLSIKQSKSCYRCVSLMEQARPFAFLQHDTQNWDEFYYLDADKQKQLVLKKTGTDMFGAFDNGTVVVFFDVFDKTDNLVAKLRFFYDVMGHAFFSFEIRSIDNKHILIESRSGFTGTEIAIYDRTLKNFHEIAQITRPLFTWSLDSELRITDKQDLLFIIDPKLFYAAVALNANTQFFYSIDQSQPKKTLASPETLQRLRKKILDFAAMREITLYAQSTDLSQEEIAAAEQLLKQHYSQMTGAADRNKENLDKDKQLENLINFGCDYLLSHSQSPREEYAVLQFLSNQLI